MVAPVIEGLGGIVVLPVGSDNDDATSVAIQSDGKILVGGHIDSDATGDEDLDFALVRFNADGTLDTTFDSDGIVTTPVGTTADVARSIVVQPDGKIILAGGVNNGISGQFAVVRYNTDGSLDTSFDTDGIQTTSLGVGGSSGTDVALQSNGNIVVVGNYTVGTNADIGVARYTSTGALDTTFDADGIVTTPIGPDDDVASGVAVDANGKIVVAGGYDTLAGSGFRDFVVARYNTDGSLDTSFGTNGFAQTPIGAANDFLNSLVIDGSGNILVAGYTIVGGISNLALARFDSNGALDTSFDGDGIVTTSIGERFDIATSVTVQSDGKILVTGEARFDGVDQIILVRYNANGSLDTTFGEGGVAATNFAPNSGQGTSVVVQSDGKIVIAGTFFNGTNNDVAVLRYNADGTLDTSFNPPAPSSYDENGAAVGLTSTLTLKDSDSTNLTGATVSITGGFVAGDQLNFADTSAISGSYDGTTGILTLSGIASVANYQAALRSITFSSTSDDPDNGGDDTTRTISWQVSDGSDQSAAVTSQVNINAEDDAPTAVNVAGTQTTIDEDASTATRTKVGDVSVTDVDGGVNALGLTGADKNLFELDGNELFLKAGVALDFEKKESFDVAVTVDADGAGGAPDATSATFTVNVGNVSPERIDGTADADKLIGGSDADIIRGLNGNDVLRGKAGDDDLKGQGGADKIYGGDNDDTLTGSSGNDLLKGDAGSDIINGGTNRDRLYGGADEDIFDFNKINESKVGSQRDIIYDFVRRVDEIDLKDIDAKKSKAGDQKFKWIGKDSFSGKEGELRYEDKGAKVYVQGDVTGNGKANFEIHVRVDKLGEGDFIF